MVAARKACHLCAGLRNPAESDLAAYDSDQIGPYSQWLCARPARLALVAQDWSTEGYYRDHQGRDVPDNLTNARLMRFLDMIGFPVKPPPGPDPNSGVFITNAILCLKVGKATEMSAPVKGQWFANCRPFLKRTLDTVEAPVVIALGVRAYKSVARAYEVKPTLSWRKAIEQAAPLLIGSGRRLFAAFHPAARPVNRTLDAMKADWRRIGSRIVDTTVESAHRRSRS